jgi:putative ABC transport system ATP-binding protein
MGTLFEFIDVHVAIEDSTILADINIAIPEGRLTVVAGVSGSGKTSLLRLCNRLDVRTSGKILFRDQDLATFDPRALRRQVGMVFQRPVLFPGTVRDNLGAAATATDAEMAVTLGMVDLDVGFLDRIGDDLSGGEAQRVCLARALMCRPQVLLMDEPTSSLHPAAANTLETTTQGLHSDAGVDVLWVTHNLDQITRLAQYLIVLSNGRVAYAGAPDATEATHALELLTEEEA